MPNDWTGVEVVVVDVSRMGHCVQRSVYANQQHVHCCYGRVKLKVS